MSRTGQVWHPMGRPRGFARRSNDPEDAIPAAAAAPVAFTKSLLDMLDIAPFPPGAAPAHISRLYALQLPTPAPFGANVRLCCFQVRDFHAGPVPHEFLAQARGYVSQKQRLRDFSGELEISTRFRFPALAGIEPFTLVSWRSRQGLGRGLKTGHFRLGNEFGMPAVEVAKNLAVVPDKQHAFVSVFALARKRPAVFQFLRAGRFQASVVPGETYRRHFSASGK